MHDSQTTNGYFTGDQVRLAEALAAQAATAIQNAWLYAQVESGHRQQQALSRRLVEIQENERRAISRELHDEAGQAFTSLIVGLLERDSGRPESVVAVSRELKQIADGVLDRLHRLAANLRPASLDRLGLLPALRQFVELSQKQTGLSIELMPVGLSDHRLAPDVEIALYRVIQEALTNVVRHAQAHHTVVILERREQWLIAIIEDDGIGFDPQEAAQRSRLGLFGMQERAEMLDGNLSIESAPGRGTTIFVQVPYEPAGVTAGLDRAEESR